MATSLPISDVLQDLIAVEKDSQGFQQSILIELKQTNALLGQISTEQIKQTVLLAEMASQLEPVVTRLVLTLGTPVPQ